MTSLSGGATRAAAAALVLGVVLAACGSTSNSGSGSGGSNNNGYSVPQSVQTAPDTPSPLPQAAAPVPSSAPQQAPAAPAPAAMTRPASVSFPLMPVAGVTGTVTIQVTGASTFSVTVFASGMAPGSTHAVHIHFGNCPSAGVHIVALASLTANGPGMATLTTTVHSPYKGDGRFLIVYAGPNPGPLSACAQLAG